MDNFDIVVGGFPGAKGNPGSAGEGYASRSALAAAVTFTPEALFEDGQAGAWYDPSDLTTLWQDSAGTVPVTTAGQSVARMDDKSGNGRHLIQATTAARPTYQVDSNGKPYLLLDGTDDGMALGSSPALPASADVFIGFHHSGAKDRFIIVEAGSGSAVAVAQNGSSSATFLTPGSEVTAVNGVQISPETRGALYTAVGTSVPKIIEVRGAALNAWTNLRISQFSPVATWGASGRVYGLIICSSLSSDERSRVRWWLGGKAGVALPAAATATALDDAFLTEAGREGKFVFVGGNLSAEVTADPQQGIYVAPAWDSTGASGAWVRQRGISTWIAGEWFGARGDGTTNDQPAIQAAVDFLGRKGGGDVVLGAKTYRANSTIDIKYPRVRLVGAGKVSTHDSGDDAVKSAIYAPFAGTTLKLRTPYAAEQGVAAASTFKYTGAACVGIALNGGGVGTKAVEIDSVSHIAVDVFATGYVGTTVFEAKCGVTGTDLGEACDIQYSRLVFRARQIDTVAERSSDILTLTGSTNANVSLNRAVDNNGIVVVAQHYDGDVLVGESADNNSIFIHAHRVGGSGKTLLAKGRTDPAIPACEANDFAYVGGAGAIYAEGTGDPGVVAAVTNRITNLDTSNGTPAPTAGTGSRWHFIDSDNVTSGSAFAGTAMADSAPAAIAEALLLGTGTLRIRNGSGNHVVLTDGTNQWSIGMDGDDLRIVRVAGSGAINLGNGAPVLLPSLTNAADDAAAAIAGVALNQLYRNGSVLRVRAA